MVSEGQLYTDIKAGDISVYIHAPFGKYTHLRIKVEAANDTTMVSVTNDYEAWDKLAKVIQDWIDNGSTFCQ